MNLTKFSPLHGAPLWAECVAGGEGDFHEDWRLLNCLNSVFLPRGFESREQMDALYNAHIERFYGSKAYRRRFGRRVFTTRAGGTAKPFERHPRQPLGLKPMPLGP